MGILAIEMPATEYALLMGLASADRMGAACIGINTILPAAGTQSMEDATLTIIPEEVGTTLEVTRDAIIQTLLW